MARSLCRALVWPGTLPPKHCAHRKDPVVSNVTTSGSLSEDPAGPPTVMHRRTVILASVTAFMVGLDVLVIMTALPTLLQTLRANATDLGWTVSAYEIGFAASILTSSALGDRFGRRAVFIAGVAIFTAGSAWCALSSA